MVYFCNFLSWAATVVSFLAREDWLDLDDIVYPVIQGTMPPPAMVTN